MRNYKLDNIRFVLIFFVVFAHLLEAFNSWQTQSIYRVIYSFHMPAFLFLTGYFAAFKPRKILLSLAYPYLLLQLVYILFNRTVLGNPLPYQVTTPYWLLWYLLVCVYYYCLTPLLVTKKPWARALILCVSVAMAIAAGLFSKIGYYLSLSRALSFLPFFIAGYYAGHPARERPTPTRFFRPRVALICAAGVVLAGYFILKHPEIPSNVMYHAVSYSATGSSPAVRAGLMLAAAFWIGLFLAWAPKRKLPVISVVGANTFSIYLLHGFVIVVLKAHQIFVYSFKANLILAAGLALGMLLLFGNAAAAKLFCTAFTGEWIYKVGKKLGSRIKGAEE